MQRDDELHDDDLGRRRALDVTLSFLVQAPAGSGKTELLIQRYLALLARVERPERILAITFTRKAAAEMRERIIAALRAAPGALPEDLAEATAHKQRTRTLALAALARDKALGWRILEHPARLAISTIDALAATLARQAPLASGLAATPRVEERAQPLYLAAARATLAAASATDPAWRTLLAHLANDAAEAVALVGLMLSKREQWLPLIAGSDPTQLRRELEHTLRAEIEAELSLLRNELPPQLAAIFATQAAYAAENLQRPEDAEWAALLRAFGAIPQGPSFRATDVAQWQAMARLLLVADDARFRVKVDVRCGFPKKGKDPGAALREERKIAMQALLAQLAPQRALATALDVARRLPPMIYEERDWQVVASLLDILPRAAAQLTVTFAAESRVDFTNATLMALNALGSPDAPSDLLLRQDLAIDHLLIDEYQDTSAIQNSLLARLTSGWTPGDGRTVFAVGDPMQSIYRFRAAEVQLFLTARAEGAVCGVPAEFIELSRNFRSQGNVVAWVNRVFPQVLAATSDPWRGLVAFVPSRTTRDAVPSIVPTLRIAATDEDEAALVIQHVQQALAAPGASIAILVRARSHLAAILPALRAANIAYAAVELDTLGARQVTLDLKSLTHALIQPADRLAWLAVLRAPWCGLPLTDLVPLSAAIDDGLIGICRDAQQFSSLSSDGQLRLQRLVDILTPVFAARGVATLTDRVRAAWLALGGPALTAEPIDREAARQYFDLLAASEVAGDIRDWDAFCEALDALHAKPELDATVRVQVMTLYRAKGLEFDTVIIPGLARSRVSSTPELLRWRARPHGLMLAPIDARGDQGSPLYAYLKALASAEAAAELGRVLYVGTTRARTRLHLTAVLDALSINSGAPVWQKPHTGSALDRLWPALAHAVEPPGSVSIAPVAGALQPPQFRRVPGDWSVAPPQPWWSPQSQPSAPAPEPLAFEWAHATAAAIGTVTHRLLAQLAREGIAAWTADRINALRARVAAELAREGIPAAEQEAAIKDTLNAITRTLADPRGRWLFDENHADARSEWALAGVEGVRIIHVTIDRTFVADGKRWIVDFKTGRHEGGDLAAFLDRERERYQEQLERYARIVRAMDPRPIELALYYPLVDNGWRNWTYTP